MPQQASLDFLVCVAAICFNLVQNIYIGISMFLLFQASFLKRPTSQTMSEKAVFEPLRGFYQAWSINKEKLSVFCQLALC